MVQVHYDPSRVSYARLLDVVGSQQPVTRERSVQYRTAIFYTSEAQATIARAWRGMLEARHGKKVLIDMRPAGPFYRAEEYHQKYLLKLRGPNAR